MSKLFKVSFSNSGLLSGHFTKDCFSAPGLQYALVPEEDDEEAEQQQAATIRPPQDLDKKKKKKVKMLK